MRVKLRTIYAGPAGSYASGQAADLPQAEAYALCEGGFAEQVDDTPAPVERAVAGPQETAEAPANKRRDPLDHDGDGRKGGAVKAKRS